MKKIIAICMALLMVLSATLTVFAARGVFLFSPSGRPTPVIVKFDPNNDACTAVAVITSYADRHSLSDAQLALIEKAYDDIANASDISALNADLAAYASKLGIDSKFLAVSNLFDIHVTGCDYHEEHRGFDVVLSTDVLDSFVGLLHMNNKGEWEFVSNAHVEQNGDHLVFEVDAFSPFAIVVDTTGLPPQTGDSVMVISSVVMVAAIVALGVVMHKRKKQIAE